MNFTLDWMLNIKKSQAILVHVLFPSTRDPIVPPNMSSAGSTVLLFLQSQSASLPVLLPLDHLDKIEAEWEGGGGSHRCKGSNSTRFSPLAERHSVERQRVWRINGPVSANRRTDECPSTLSLISSVSRPRLESPCPR